MLIKTNINEKYKEAELHVCKDVLDDEVKQIVGILHSVLDKSVGATDEIGNKVSLQPADIISLFAQDQKVYALDMKGKKYTVSQKLYELEQDLENSFFTRISKSELVNTKRIKSLDMSMTGTIKIIMKNGYETYTSRRNVVKIKNLLVKHREEAE